MENKDKPTFPCLGNIEGEDRGLTKLEYFSGLAMQATISRLSNEDFFKSFMKMSKDKNISTTELLSRIAIGHAESLLNELEK
jgi:hypothetical protein